ncbi:uncharacterized protein LOC110030339 [Phalaenopsis equestris]|uniref:uncharacterized protein LOC110030339 n=1 Tax=Phalaenopsis equestris TaxID=78828 RepID=UPI0009E4A3B2|nr:uncharacterized protein LOC110030339 [Phalaenopsis equestris]
MGALVHHNWMVGGDFNMVMHDSEKLDGRRIDTTLIDKFNEALDLAGISDLGFVGSRSGSDHNPLLLSFDCFKKVSTYHFYYLNVWARHDDFLRVIATNWRCEEMGNAWFTLWKLHKKVASALRSWNWDVFGDVHGRVKSVEQRVNLLQALDEYSYDIIHDLQEANKELLEASLWEEELLQQKTGKIHFSQGDKNTKYFHACIKQRRVNNTIVRNKNDEGCWINGDEEIGESDVLYFFKLFEFHEN